MLDQNENYARECGCAYEESKEENRNFECQSVEETHTRAASTLTAAA